MRLVLQIVIIVMIILAMKSMDNSETLAWGLVLFMFSAMSATVKDNNN